MDGDTGLYFFPFFRHIFYRTLGLIKPDAFEKFNQILETIYESGFRLTNLKMCRLSREEAGAFYQEHQAKSFYKYVYACNAH